MKKHQTVKLQDAEALAKVFAAALKGGEILALTGPLGSGKTTFTKALGKGLKVKRHVTSPTFVIMNRYQGKTAAGKKVWLYHLDLYRTGSFAEVAALGLKELWNKSDAITVIEWAGKIKRNIPKSAAWINFEH